MDWADLVPREVAIEQKAYEIDYRAWRMRQVGFTYAEIGRRLGVDDSWAKQRVKRYLRRKYIPVERYLKIDLYDKAALSRMKVA
jgi:hypothetical protein